MIKCTEEEKAFLIKKLGEEKVNTLPWWDDKTGDDIAAELDFIIISEGMTPDQNFLTDIGIKYQRISDSLCFQNSAYCAILTILEKSMGDKNFDPQSISPEALGETKKERDSTLRRMAKRGQIEGLSIPSDPTERFAILKRRSSRPKGSIIFTAFIPNWCKKPRNTQRRSWTVICRTRKRENTLRANGPKSSKRARELTEQERKENADIL